MSALVPAFACFPPLFQYPVHGTGGAAIDAFIQQSGLHGSRRAVLESFFMQMRQHRFAFGCTQRTRRSRSRLGYRSRMLLAIERGTNHAERIASCMDSNIGSEFVDGGHQRCLSGSTGGIGAPNSAATFF
jgi:hypothetical protein